VLGYLERALERGCEVAQVDSVKILLRGGFDKEGCRGGFGGEIAKLESCKAEQLIESTQRT